MTPPTDIIIPFHSTSEFNTAELLRECVSTLVETTHNFRLIFVDDCSDELGRVSLHNIASRFPECIVVRTYKQRWFTRATNLGLRMVRTPWCVEANSDVIFGVGWLEELYAVREEIETNGKALRIKVGLVGSVYSSEDPRRYVVTNQPDYVTGHCWLINMEAAEQVGISHGTPKDCLDETSEKTIHIFSDNFMCYEMNRLGWQTVKSLKSGVGHIAGKSWGHQLHRIPSKLEDVNFQYGN
jgi:glycosyltransferase involved in cell wall biosynthesis